MNPPVARINDQMGAMVPGAGSGPDLWTEVHGQVQNQLALLESAVRQKVPGVRVMQGRTKGEMFYLFTYRTFSLPEKEADPIVCGITFAPAAEGVAIEADVSGEQSGLLLFSLPGRTVPSCREALLSAGTEAARELGTSADKIAETLEVSG